MLKFFKVSGFPVSDWSALSGLVFVFLFSLLFSFNISLASAQTGHDTNSGSADSAVWGDQADTIQGRTGLGNDDPRNIAANIINIALGFLGILAIIIIMYAGFLWMMSGGNPDNINKAKRILIGGFIGLVIVLSSFAIASFVLDAIFRATTGTGSNGGGSTFPGPGGTGGGTGDNGGNGEWQLACSSTTEGECNPDQSMCDVLGPQWTCNDSCKCVVENMGSCYNPVDDICNYPCKVGLSCYGFDGCEDNLATGGCGAGDTSCYCCCSPADDQCGLIYPTLECRPDIAPCDSDADNRGMCCGCEADNECGGINLTGCGSDTCCHPRPTLIETVPLNGAVDVCTNPLVSIQFDQPMKSNSLADNILLVGEYTTPCPSDTTDLINVSDTPIVDTANNYCSVKGSTRIRNEGGNYYVDFSPSNFLDINTVYHIVILGGDLNGDGNNIEGGVQNFWAISKLASEYRTFRTINDPSEAAGVCMIERVSLTPTSYLFRTTQNSAREDDTDAASDTFDSARDGDKLFVARAISSSNQVITSMIGYAWNWILESSATAVIALNQTIPGLNNYIYNGTTLNNGMVLAGVMAGVTDGRSIISATVEMPADQIHQEGNGYTDSSNVYVFICDNPWPPVDASADPMWEPWAPIPNEFNYDIYYCRDKLPKGTVDDLPAFDSAGVAAENFSPDANSQEVLQSVYFSYETPPAPSNITELISIGLPDYPDGGTVHLEWGNATAFSEAVAGYKVHWGDRSGAYANHEDVAAVTEANITGLTNERAYYFSVTAYTADQAESSYYNEMIVIPRDIVSPTETVIFLEDEFEIGINEIELYWSEVEGAHDYQISYGLGINTEGAVVNVDGYTGVVIENLTPDAIYSFVVRVVDEAGNIGLASDRVEIATLSSL